MARSAQTWTGAKIEKCAADGFGTGTGRDYKPWLMVGRTTPSLGTSNRPAGRTTGRVHHFLSNIEQGALLIYDWSASVVDIREEFPLERAETLAIRRGRFGSGLRQAQRTWIGCCNGSKLPHAISLCVIWNRLKGRPSADSQRPAAASPTPEWRHHGQLLSAAPRQ